MAFELGQRSLNERTGHVVTSSHAEGVLQGHDLGHSRHDQQRHDGWELLVRHTGCSQRCCHRLQLGGRNRSA